MSDKMHTKYLIIGAGLAGLSTAYYLEDNYILAESSESVGGSAGTIHYEGYKLDNAVHILYCRQNETLDWIKNTLGVELLERNRHSSVWINNSFVRFPVQYNLSDLPLHARYRSSASLIRSLFLTHNYNGSVNFEKYSLSVFGKYLTDIFIRPYNEKLFGTEIRNLNTEWMGDYVPHYSKIKMILSAAGLADNAYGRNSRYYYPSQGGISNIAEGILSKIKSAPLYNSSLNKLSLKKSTAYFSNGLEVHYDNLINTIPLDRFLQVIDDLPGYVNERSVHLRKNPTTILHLLMKGKINRLDYHWIYFPDPDIPFYRVTFPGNINSGNCPEGYSAITLELGGDVYKDQNTANKSLAVLRETGIINNSASEIRMIWKLLVCGYVIYDDLRSEATDIIFSFLRKQNVWSIGRYGNWEYSNMEDAILQGKQTAERLKEHN